MTRRKPANRNSQLQTKLFTASTIAVATTSTRPSAAIAVVPEGRICGLCGTRNLLTARAAFCRNCHAILLP